MNFYIKPNPRNFRTRKYIIITTYQFLYHEIYFTFFLFCLFLYNS